MKKGALSLILLAVSLACGAQGFLDNPDYIYGVGLSADEYSADSLAMLSLSRAIYTDVVNESTYDMEEEGTKYTEKFSKKVSLKTAIRINGARKLVETTPDGQYEVYYYVNKAEYIERHLGEYAARLNDVSRYENSDSPHAVNYTLGALYMAYEAVDDLMLNILCKESISCKAYVVSEIRRILDYPGYILSARKSFSDNWKEIRDENENPLPGFEYVNENGEWATPKFFYNGDRERCKSSDPSEYKWAFIDLSGTTYRLTFEREVGGRSERIIIPERFYVDIDPNMKCTRYFIF